MATETTEEIRFGLYKDAQLVTRIPKLSEEYIDHLITEELFGELSELSLIKQKALNEAKSYVLRVYGPEIIGEDIDVGDISIMINAYYSGYIRAAIGQIDE